MYINNKLEENQMIYDNICNLISCILGSDLYVIYYVVICI